MRDALDRALDRYTDYPPGFDRLLLEEPLDEETVEAEEGIGQTFNAQRSTFNFQIKDSDSLPFES
jgi:hypothetical protein